MRYLSVCAGIEAASVAWHSLGWTPVAFSEIEPFPSAVLKHHYPDVQNWGDMTKFKEWPDADVDVLIGGTPCQSFSVAGLRKGLADPRGNLALTFLAIADKYRPTWVVWENVPGVLSSAGGRDFAAFLGGLGELGYGWAYRVLDAQYFGVAQRRRRVFVVGCLGNWAAAAAVLFERESLSGHPAPSREARQGASGSVAHSLTAGGFDASEDGTGRGTPLIPEVCGTLSDGAHNGDGLNGQDAYSGRIIPAVVGALTAKGPEAMGAPEVDAQHYLPITFGAQMSTPQTDVDMVQTLQAKNPMAVAQPVAVDIYNHMISGDCAGSLTTSGGPPSSGPAVMVAQPVNIYGGNKRSDRPEGGFYVRTDEDTSKTLDAASGLNPTCSQGGTAVMHAMQVRRLTPVECERLQGFPDNYTAISWRGKPADQCPDGPRYKALGNSMAVPVIKWLGERIQMVNDLLEET